MIFEFPFVEIPEELADAIGEYGQVVTADVLVPLNMQHRIFYARHMQCIMRVVMGFVENMHHIAVADRTVGKRDEQRVAVMDDVELHRCTREQGIEQKTTDDRQNPGIPQIAQAQELEGLFAFCVVAD